MSEKPQKNYALFRQPHLHALWLNFVNSCMEKNHSPQLDVWLKKQFAQNRSWGKNDRAWYRDEFFKAMRWGWCATLAYWQAKNISTDIQTPQQLFEVWQTMPPEDIFDITSKAFLQFQTSLQESPNIKNLLNLAGIPIWFKDVLQKRQTTSNWNEQTLHTFLGGQNTRPPLWLRPPHARFEPIQAENSVCPEGFEPQDWASQKVGFSVPLLPHQHVWDACAGGGGKALLLAQRLASTGMVYASDLRERLFKEIQHRSEKNDLKNITFFSWSTYDGIPTQPPAVQEQGGFDVVLVDAPCSGSGTWRRNPDGRFRSPHPQSPQGKSLIELQNELLHLTSHTVRPGGILAYVTCSWFVEENEEVVEHFLKNHSDFILTHQELVGFPQENADTLFLGMFLKAHDYSQS